MEQVREERILVTVKTYPTLSRKYGETVCTAGVREDGSWVRLYPVPFRRLGEKEHYRKYDWLTCRVIRSTKDSRPETFHPVDPRANCGLLAILIQGISGERGVTFFWEKPVCGRG